MLSLILFLLIFQDKEMRRRLIVSLWTAILMIIVINSRGYCETPAPAAPDATAPSEGTAWSPAADCATCHPRYVNSMQDTKLLAGLHAKAKVAKCSKCHNEETLKQTHANVTGPKTIIKARRYPQSFCLSCHGSIEQLAKETANSKSLTDLKGRAVNPHDLPKTPTHEQSKIDECANCHKMHKQPVSEMPVNAMAYCTGCHHKQEFSCNNCHGDKK
jgi:cytochrome c553